MELTDLLMVGGAVAAGGVLALGGRAAFGYLAESGLLGIRIEPVPRIRKSKKPEIIAERIDALTLLGADIYIAVNSMIARGTYTEELVPKHELITDTTHLIKYRNQFKYGIPSGLAETDREYHFRVVHSDCIYEVYVLIERDVTSTPLGELKIMGYGISESTRPMATRPDRTPLDGQFRINGGLISFGGPSGGGEATTEFFKLLGRTEMAFEKIARKAGVRQ